MINEMPIQRRYLRKAILQAIISGIRRNGERIFDIANDTETCHVPVDTGNLKHSGYIDTKYPGGMEIGFTAPYASAVELGSPAKPITGTQSIYTHGYRRKDGVMVAPHYKHFVGKRLIAFRPKMSKFERGPLIFRVLNEEPAREGQHFLGRALKEGLHYLVQDVDFYFQRLGRS